MSLASSFYFSQIIGNKVYSESGSAIGRLKDLIVDENFAKPKVVAVRLNTPNEVLTVDFSSFKFEKTDGKYRIETAGLKEYKQDGEKTFYLKNILDKQIIDMDGRKLVRVNDLEIATLANGTFLIAADVGFEGLFRRLGFAKILKKLLKPTGIVLSSHLILWDDVETVDYGHSEIKLSKDYSNLEKLHPSDLADIIEDMNRYAQIAVISSMDEEKAADVLEDLEPEIQKSVLENLPVDKAADLLEKMPADEAADILDELRDDKVEELLKEIEEEASDDIREILEYPDNSVGSIMITEYIIFNENQTVDETIKELRKLKPEPDIMYYLYIVDDTGKLVATVTPRDLIVSEPETPLKQIMNSNIIYVFADDKIESLNEIITKYNLLAIPVVNPDEQLMGVVIINDMVYNLLKNKMKKI
jgi:CBS domain-containing protein/sporulation protein YlmC with PRC-barrel domain